MTKDNLKGLAVEIMGHLSTEGGAYMLPQKGYQKFTVGFPAALRSEMHRLVEETASVIPDDIGFGFFFDAQGTSLCFGLSDGFALTQGGRPYFTSRESMLLALGSSDWDAIRARLINEGAAVEAMVSGADDRPVNIPSSLEAAKRYLPELKEVVDELAKDSDTVPFILVYARNDRSGVDVDGPYFSRADLTKRIGPLMGFGYDILTVFKDGVTCDFDEVEVIKREAVQLLGPIERAKAERRLPLT